MKKIIVGITGASGSIYAVRLMEVLCRRGIEIHAVVTTSGEKVLDYECGITREELSRRVTKLYANDDVGAAIASGSFRMDAMVILPCSMRAAGAPAHGVTTSWGDDGTTPIATNASRSREATQMPGIAPMAHATRLRSRSEEHTV